MKSLFFVPSNRAEFFNKAAELDCDAVIFDLEDAIAPDQITQGLDNIRNNIHFFKNKQKKYVRIDSENFLSTLDAISNIAVDGYVIPKFETREVLNVIVDRNPNAEIILLVETVKGFQRLTDGLIPEMKNIKGLAFGAEDYCQDMGCSDSFFNLLFARTRLIEAARMNGIEAYDTIYPFIRDDDGFLKSLHNARDMGFDGKMLIHPGQLDLFNKEKDENLSELVHIAQEYDANLNKGITVSVINGRIYERNHIDHIKRKISEMTRRSE